MLDWNNPICESCWIEKNSEWENIPDKVDVQRLSSIRMPVRLTNPEIEICGWCGNPTIFGAYLRADPAEVPFPREKKS